MMLPLLILNLKIETYMKKEVYRFLNQNTIF